VFIVGVVLGTIGFAVFYGAALKSLKAAWLIAEGDTFTDAYAIPEVVMLGLLGIALVAVFYFGSWFERRGSGTVTAQQALEGAR
jgi:hypothetical protein